MEDITSFGISGIYSLLILSLTFSFLLALRIKRLNQKVLKLEEYFKEQMGLIHRSLETPGEKEE